MRIDFTQSTCRHKVGTARVLEVRAIPLVIVCATADRELNNRLLDRGDDDSGRALEVIAIEQKGRLIVIHAMDLGPKHRGLTPRVSQSLTGSSSASARRTGSRLTCRP